MCTFPGGLRGEEVSRVLRKHFLLQNQEVRDCFILHTVLTLYGNFKNDQGVARYHLLQLVCRSKSELNMEKWVRRVTQLERHSKTMFLFAEPNGRKERIGSYEDYFVILLEKSQRTNDGDLISKQLDISEDFGLGRFGRRVATTASINAPNDECKKTILNEIISRNKSIRLGFLTHL